VNARVRRAGVGWTTPLLWRLGAAAAFKNELQTEEASLS